MTRNKFITYVDIIKRIIKTIEFNSWTNRNSPDKKSYGSFYDISINILSETFNKKFHRDIFIDMFRVYQRDGRFTAKYNINDTIVRTPIELYDCVVTNN